MLAKKYMLGKASLAPTFSHSGTTSAVECRVQHCRRHRPVVKHSSAFEGLHCITSTDKPSREIVFSMEPKCSFAPHLQSELHDMFVQSFLPRPEIIPSTRWRKVQRANVCLLSPWYRPARKKRKMSPRLPASKNEHDCCSSAFAGARSDCYDHFIACPGNAVQGLRTKRAHPHRQLVIAVTMPLTKTNWSLRILGETSTLEMVLKLKRNHYFVPALNDCAMNQTKKNWPKSAGQRIGFQASSRSTWLLLALPAASSWSGEA